jgi:hypothetical protein
MCCVGELGTRSALGPGASPPPAPRAARWFCYGAHAVEAKAAVRWRGMQGQWAVVRAGPHSEVPEALISTSRAAAGGQGPQRETPVHVGHDGVRPHGAARAACCMGPHRAPGRRTGPPHRAIHYWPLDQSMAQHNQNTS